MMMKSVFPNDSWAFLLQQARHILRMLIEVTSDDVMLDDELCGLRIFS